MSIIKRQDEQEALKLDEHFKQTLTHVKSHVMNLTTLEEANLCRIWLDKLNSVIMQRNLRNEYLLELLRQLKAGALEGIFKTKPPNNLLMPLPLPCHSICISSSLSELSDYDRNSQNCLTLSEKSSRRDLQSQIRNSYSACTTNPYVYSHNDKNNTTRSHLNSYKRRIDMLTVALKNFQIQNGQLKQELTKYQEKLTDNDVVRLRNNVKQLTIQAQNENLAWKVRALKKTIVKLKKLNSSIEQIYEKKLDRIIRDKNLEIKTLQLQFQGKTSELCLSLCEEKQGELYSLVEALEKKYKTLLAGADATVESQRQEYFTKIKTLEAELCCLRNSLQKFAI